MGNPLLTPPQEWIYRVGNKLPTGTVPASACGGINTPKRMTQPVARDSWLYVPWMPPKDLLREIVVTVIFTIHPGATESSVWAGQPT